MAKLLREILDSSYPHKIMHKEKDNSHQTIATFNSSKGNDYSISVGHYGNNHVAGVAFSSGAGEAKGVGDMGINGMEKNSSHKIFGTVKKVIQAHVAKHPHVTHIEFTSDEPSRDKLYHHFSKSIDKDYKHEIDPFMRSTNFLVKVPK